MRRVSVVGRSWLEDQSLSIYSAVKYAWSCTVPRLPQVPWSLVPD